MQNSEPEDMRMQTEFFLLLVLVIFAHSWFAQSETLYSKLSPFRGIGILPRPIPISRTEIKACWYPVRSVPGCANSIFESSHGNKIDLTSECCRAVQSIGDSCLNKILMKVFFIRALLPKIDDYCDSKLGLSPSS